MTTGGLAESERTTELIEHRTIGQIPENERNGTSKGLFGVWFGIIMLPITVITGALATTVFGLPFWWGLLANVLGNVIGGVFIALHASQGPTLGVPQMLQARGQFGSKGASILVLAAFVMFTGFFVSGAIVAAKSVHSVWSGVSTDMGVAIAVVVSLAITVTGLKALKAVISFGAVVVGVVVLVTFIKIFADGVPAGTFTHGAYSAAGFFSMLAIAVVWQIAYAPYVSDYSRYMPTSTGPRLAFWATYVGSVLSTIYAMTLGTLLGLLASDGDPITGIHTATDGLATIILLAFAFTSMMTNAGNIYCATLTSLTFLESFRPGWIPNSRGRLVTIVVLHVASFFLAINLSGNFLENFNEFMTILLYVLIPWSAINLVDYFLIAHGDYTVSDFFRADGGRYGRWNVAALVVYAIGVAVQVPFAAR